MSAHRRGAGLLVLAALAGAAAACESLRASTAPELPVWMNRPAFALSVVYERRIAAPSRDEVEPYERGRPALDVKGRRVFVGSSDRGLYALDAADGSVLWRFETLGAVQCEPLYDPAEDTVWFGSNDGALYKVRASDGGLLFRFATSAEVARQPVVAGGRVIAMNANDTLLALDRETGVMAWSQHRAPALGMEIAGYAGPLVHRGLVYAAFSDGTVTAYDLGTGAERWAPVDLSAEAEEARGDGNRYLDVDTTPVAGTVDDLPVVYVGSYEGGVHALDADTGARIWARPDVAGASDLLVYREPARPREGAPDEPGRELLLAATGTTGLWALDPATGETRWHRALPAGGVAPPVPLAGALLVTTTQQGLYLLSPRDGSVIDGIHTGAGFSMAAAAHGLRAFVLGNGGNLLSLHVSPPRPPG